MVSLNPPGGSSSGGWPEPSSSSQVVPSDRLNDQNCPSGSRDAKRKVSVRRRSITEERPKPPTLQRVEHLDRIRSLQDETGGFTAFICWTMQPGHKMSDYPEQGAFEYLRVQAIARLYLDNVPNIQSSWVTQGAKIGQLALFFGANDMGSLMIEENVVASAGTVHHLTLEQIRSSIREAGWVPRQRAYS